jgi:hypothetical protein
MPKIFNPADFVKIGVYAFAFIFIANRALDKFGMSQFKA